MTRVARPKFLAEAVTQRLRREIVEGAFAFGQALSETKIAARYDVSRTPVREAFALLGLEGLVRTEPQHGTFVFTMDREEFAQLSETRSILETAALRLACERGREALVERWEALVATMTDAIRDDEARLYSDCDGRFHEALFEIAGNPYLTSASQSFHAKMAAVRNRLGSEPEHMRKSHDEHGALLSLVAGDDIGGAAQLLERHIRFKGESFWQPQAAAPKSRWQRIAELAE